MTKVTQINGKFAAPKKHTHRLLSLLHPGMFDVCKEDQLNFSSSPHPVVVFQGDKISKEHLEMDKLLWI